MTTLWVGYSIQLFPFVSGWALTGLRYVSDFLINLLQTRGNSNFA
jgi:hypothetical protein